MRPIDGCAHHSRTASSECSLAEVVEERDRTDASSSDLPTAGTVLLGRYRLDALIGSGGSADVWRAHDQRSERAVTLKLLRDRDDPQIRRRFLDEARRLTAVRHPGIVDIFGMHDALGHTFIVLELIEGPSLAEELSRRSFSLADTASITLQLSRALEVLHQHGLLHLDLKPANILIGAGQQVRLIDLGIAGAIGSIPELIRGTPRYVAPEVRAGEPVTPATDVYGLALVARELLGGQTEDRFIGRVLRRSLDPRPARRHQRPRSFALAFATAVVIGQELGMLRERRDQVVAALRLRELARIAPRMPVALLAARSTWTAQMYRAARHHLLQRSAALIGAALGAAWRTAPRAALAAACAVVVVVALAVPRLSPAAAGVDQRDRAELPVASPLVRAAYALPALGAYAARFESQADYPTATINAPVGWVVAVRNTGSAGWQRGVAGAQAALALADGTVVAVQTTAYVGPGQVGWFVARFRAPAQPGTHIVPLRVVIEGMGALPDLGIHAVVTVTR